MTSSSPGSLGLDETVAKSRFRFSLLYPSRRPAVADLKEMDLLMGKGDPQCRLFRRLPRDEGQSSAGSHRPGALDSHGGGQTDRKPIRFAQRISLNR